MKFYQTSTVDWKVAVVQCVRHGLLRTLVQPGSWYWVDWNSL